MAHVLRATATAGMKDIGGAVESMQEAAKLDPIADDTIIDLATLQLSQGKRAEAEAGFKQAVAVAPKAVQPRLSLAGFYWSHRPTRAQAEAELQQAVPSIRTCGPRTWRLRDSIALPTVPLWPRRR